MPNNIIQQAAYADPLNMNLPSLPYGGSGQLGARFTVTVPIGVPATGPTPSGGASKSFQIVLTDSGQGIAPTAGMVAMWKDKAGFVVTTDQLRSLGRNALAGIFNNSVTSGNYTCVQWGGPAFVQITPASAAAVAQGDQLIMSAGDNGKSDRVAVGTAPTYQVIGYAEGAATAANTVLTSVQIASSATT
jgi:hypothetical protein